MAVISIADDYSQGALFADCLFYLHRDGSVSLISEGRGMETAIAVALSIIKSFDTKSVLGGIETFTEERNQNGKRQYISKLKIDLVRKARFRSQFSLVIPLWSLREKSRRAVFSGGLGCVGLGAPFDGLLTPGVFAPIVDGSWISARV